MRRAVCARREISASRMCEMHHRRWANNGCWHQGDRKCALCVFIRSTENLCGSSRYSASGGEKYCICFDIFLLSLFIESLVLFWLKFYVYLIPCLNNFNLSRTRKPIMSIYICLLIFNRKKNDRKLSGGFNFCLFTYSIELKTNTHSICIYVV